MSELRNKLALAKREIGRSVVYINPKLQEESETKDQNPLFFGLKDTNQIPEPIINRLRNSPNYLWLTVDKASNRGRAIDTDLLNPLTYRAMTGSTSGGPINIVKGITDFAVGTDGGGSVLAPALSCQLSSIIGAGFGLLVKNEKKSTDGLTFTGSIGVIGKNIDTLKEVMECIVGARLEQKMNHAVKVVVPKKGTIICPDGQDMYEKVMRYLSKVQHNPYIVEELAMDAIDNREQGIKAIREAFEQKGADLIVTCEGPVDLYGYGETIPHFFAEPGQGLTRGHGKYLLRAANMCEATAVTVPIETLATGLVIIAKKGLDAGAEALELAAKLEKVIAMPEIWKRYIIEGTQFTGLDLQ
ncbi:hypothetical protein PZE06_18025 [Robertmurraya sp. DFI.2.37]|uniref:hypothetical protein n=1 Tax=Robertmurraya sp. DFI.2.37 TaxID=3031819 RepID=UPI0023D9E0DA|nr:hypothetical protein [Robertmurraya sp. DFI.2.37]MDF1510039.1 hypothetical protein [Robertmurraya sp. DFI.2.37]